jgi:hypothetical protein
LVNCDADRDSASRRFRGQSPVACRDSGNRRPVRKRIASDSRGRQLADDRGKCAADEPEIGRRDPSPGGPEGRRANRPPISTEIQILTGIGHFFAVPGSAIFRC